MPPRRKVTKKLEASSGSCDHDGTRQYVKAPTRRGRSAQQRPTFDHTNTLCSSDPNTNAETSESDHPRPQRSKKLILRTSMRHTRLSSGKENVAVSSQGKTNSKPKSSKKSGSTTSRSSCLADLIDRKLSYADKRARESELSEASFVEVSCIETDGDLPANLVSSESNCERVAIEESSSQEENDKGNKVGKECDGSKGNSRLSTWLQSSRIKDRLILTAADKSRSVKSVKRVAADEVPFTKNNNAQTPITVRCRDVLKSTAHVSTPRADPSTEDEDLFGFENLLNYNEPTLNLSNRFSPISEKNTEKKRDQRTRKNKHARILTASQKQDCETEPWQELLEYNTSKLYENKRKKRTKAAKTQSVVEKEHSREEVSSELLLFDITNDHLVRKDDIPVYEFGEEETEKQKKKRQEIRKPCPVIRKDELLPWDEIMAHELVIETV